MPIFVLVPLIAVLAIAGVFVGGMVWGVGDAAGWGKKGKRALKEPQRPKPYAYLDTAETTKEQVVAVARGYVSDEALGPIAQDVLDTFARADLLQKDVLSLLRREFEEGSLSWDKFSVPVDAALEGILTNATHITNRMQAFDSAEYLRLDRFDRAGGLEGKQTEERRLAVMRSTLDEMHSIQEANDRLLLELEKLQAELNKLSGEDVGTATDAIAEEIHSLVEETHYYA